jgi:hypothetical protein
MLLGLIFVTSLFGMTIGAAFGAMGGAFRDCGISDALVKARVANPHLARRSRDRPKASWSRPECGAAT